MPYAHILFFIFAVISSPTAYPSQIVKASWYSEGHHSRMANGRLFDPSDEHIAAHRTLPFGTVLLVTNIENGKELGVVIEDRGPYIKGRSLDISRAGAKRLGFLKKGVVRVRVTVVHLPERRKSSSHRGNEPAANNELICSADD